MDFKNSISKLAKNISEGASNVANTVAKTSSEMVEKSKLLSSIGSCKKEVRDLYGSLGEVVYSKSKEGLIKDDEVSYLIDKIDRINEDINSLQSKLDELSSEKTCKTCGKELDKDVRFCPFCGAKQEVEEEAEETEETEEIKIDDEEK
jgi:methyl-accepting chemotaxis protein